MKIVKRFVPLILLIMLVFPHLQSFGNGYVDIEKLYVESASQIATKGVSANLSDYYKLDANPLLTSLLFAASYKIWGENPVVSRVTIFVLSSGFVIFLYYYLKHKLGALVAFFAALFLAVNPLFIVYSQYVASDVDFMIFSSIAFLLLIFPYSTTKDLVISSVMFGVSMATKYAVVVLSPVVLIISFLKSHVQPLFSKNMLYSLFLFNGWYFTLATIVALPIILIVFHFQSRLLPLTEVPISLSITWFVPRLCAYLIWLGFFVGPSSLIFIISLWEKISKVKFLFLFISLISAISLLNVFYPLSSLIVEREPLGAVSLGGIQNMISTQYLTIILFMVLMASGFFIAHAIIQMVEIWSSKEVWLKNNIFWGIAPIPMMAVNRAVARYMLFVLVPICLYLAYVTEKMYSERNKRTLVTITVIIHIVGFLAIGTFSNYYLRGRGLGG